MKEFAKKIYEKTEAKLGANTGKIVTVILFGILLLVVVIPVDGCGEASDESENSSLYEDGSPGAAVSGDGSTVGKTVDSYVSGDSDGSYSMGLFATGASGTSETEVISDIQNISGEAEYYETRLKNILECSYGQGNVEVMVHMTKDSEKGLYGDVSEESVIDGVLVVADLKTANELLEISEAVCALFNLPACKVYVIKKS